MKIGILTFHAAFNYGSMLQAWALQMALSDLGHDVKIINFRNSRQKRMYRKPFASLNPQYFLGDLNKFRKWGKVYIHRRKRWNQFNRFMRENMNLTEEYDAESWNRSEKDFDVIITGSDQIWNLNAYDFDEIYLGKGISPHIRLVAYAPSLGPLPERMDKEKMKMYLQRYSHVSTREDGAKNYLLKNNIYSYVERVLDPTLLVDISKYAQFIHSTSPVKYPFSYFYTPGNHPDILNKAFEISTTLRLPLVVDLGYFSTKIPPGTHTLADAGPSEFLSYIKHSEVVIGASFHLIVFAILMHKDFYCINGDVDERLNNLLKVLSLEERVISLSTAMTLNLPPINWEIIDFKLSQLRKQSYQYLITATNS